MCNFISWIEFEGGDTLFLTAKDIYETKRGEELRFHCQSVDDLVGHGAIRWYYHDILGGKEIERINFSSPKNFPNKIVKAIKDGEFRGLAVIPSLLVQTIRIKYNRLQGSALAEYNRAWRSALAEYHKALGPVQAEYVKTGGSTLAKYKKVQEPAWAEFKRVDESAQAEYEKVRQTIFWDLFSNPKNRVKAWR